MYLGRGPGPGEERVAVKVLRSSAHTDVLQRLGRELEAIHQVQPFVTARVIEAAVADDLRYVVSEFIDGPSLQDRVDQGGPLAEGELVRLAVGTATALTAIHGAGVVHRDFKPANVLLGPDGPRVVDFGIARLTDRSTLTSGLIGTPSYMAPEQLTGERPSAAVDIFAWAVTMIFAATGESAFGADTVPAVMHRILYGEADLSRVPALLRPLLTQCLTKTPAARPSARDVLLRLVDPSLAGPAAGPLARLAETSLDAAAAGQPVAGQALAGQPLAGPPSVGYPLAGQPSAGQPVTGQMPGAMPPLPTSASVPLAPSASVPPLPTSASVPLADGGMRTPLLPGRPVRPRSRRSLLVGAGAVAAALVAAVVAALTLSSHGGHPQAGAGPGQAAATRPASSPAASNTGTSGTGTSGTGTSSAPGPGAATGPAIPAAFAGVWTGTAAMSGSGVSLPPHPITFRLDAGGRTAAETEAGGCVNTLTLTAVTASTLTFNEPQTANCEAGTTTFTRQGGHLAYKWVDAAGLTQQSGNLHKS